MTARLKLNANLGKSYYGITLSINKVITDSQSRLKFNLIRLLLIYLKQFYVSNYTLYFELCLFWTKILLERLSEFSNNLYFRQ